MMVLEVQALGFLLLDFVVRLHEKLYLLFGAMMKYSGDMLILFHFIGMAWTT